VAAHQAARHHAEILNEELKTCQDTRLIDQMTAERLQHEELVERLVERGYQRDNIKTYPIYSASAAPSKRCTR
jgi:predicted Ser/Thr protein kinase